MKFIAENKLYDTAAARLIGLTDKHSDHWNQDRYASKTINGFTIIPSFFEEVLYRTKNRKFFLIWVRRQDETDSDGSDLWHSIQHGHIGQETALEKLYPLLLEQKRCYVLLQTISDAEAAQWIQKYLSAETYIELFGPVEEA